MFGVILDDVTYNLRVKFGTIGRSFRIEDGPNASNMLSGLYKRDIMGTYYDYSMEIEQDPNNPTIYDQFYEAISAPVDSHKLILPYGQGLITFDAMVTGGSDYYRGKIANVNRWNELQVQFTAQKPQREPT